MRFGVSLVASALLVGCATLPEVYPWLTPSGQKPAIVGARGALSPDQAAAVLKRLQSKGEGSDLLAKHLAIEEEVAGRPLTVGNGVRLLNDGPASYREMFDAIERARDHIHVEFYIIESDEVGQRLSEALLRKSAQGVAINLMYDSVGSSEAQPEFFKRLREGGVQVLEYNPVNPLRARGAWRLNNRNHRKVVIVDGVVAFTGGINISNVYASSSSGSGGSGSGAFGSSGGSRVSRKAGWRDTNVRIEGPAVEQLQQLFLDTWAKQKGPTLAQRDWFPAAASPKGEHPVRIVASGPGDEVPSIYIALLTAMAYADKSIHITMAYFVPDPQTLGALKGAAARGVDVKLVLPSYTDFWAVFHAGRSHYSELLSAGVKIYERQEALLHSKTIVIDGVWSTVGSANLDWRSYLHNEELNAVVLGVDFGAQMERMFENDLAKSVPIEREAWARRSINVRVKELAARAWEYWL
jgi:cardiolipin synthase A/B